MGEIAIRSPWWVRWLTAMHLRRPSAPTTIPAPEREHRAGTDFIDGQPAWPAYRQLEAMAAFAANPWLYAAVRTRAQDLAGLPMRVRRGRGKSAVVLDDHAVLGLLRRPSSRVPGVLFRRQAEMDLTMCGNAYAVVLPADPRRAPEALLRLHPERVQVIPSGDGQPEVYRYNGQGTTRDYPWERVLHVRYESWEDGPQGVYGQGLVRALRRPLAASMSADEANEAMAQQRRPWGLLVPKVDGDTWTPEQVPAIRQALDAAIRKSHGGVSILGVQAELKSLGWNPRDMDFESLQQRVREAVLAAADTPPTRVGLPQANYATAREQERIFWTSLLGEAALFDVEYTRLAGMYGDPAVEVYHDFAGVPVFQFDRSERLERVRIWNVELGMPRAAAAAYEGFDDAPFAPQDIDGVGADGADGGAERSAPSGAIGRVFGVGPRMAVLDAEHATEEDRVRAWDVWQRGVHAVGERSLNVAVRRYLRGLGERVAARMPEVLAGRPTASASPRGSVAPVAIVRDLTEDDLDRLIDEAEEQRRLDASTAKQLRQILDRAYRDAIRTMGVATYDPTATDAVFDAMLGTYVSTVTDGTRSIVRDIVNRAVADGSTIAEMQRTLLDHPEFGYVRSLRIARTETTRAVAGGDAAAYRQAAAAGLHVEVEWLTARDEHVRLSHRALDGQTIMQGEYFVIPSGVPHAGAKALGPGGFADAAEVVNCRCTTIPHVRRPPS